MHITLRCTCANTHRHTEQSVRCSDEEMMSLLLVTALNTVVTTFTQRPFFWKKKEKGALDVAPSVIVNDDGASPPRTELPQAG